jgi:hypothetical protein
MAVEVLAAGATHKSAAEFAGVHRVTVTRWCSLPDFTQALEAQRAANAAIIRDRARGVTLQALGVIQRALAEGDLPAALGWLRHAPRDHLTDVPERPAQINVATFSGISATLSPDRLAELASRYLDSIDTDGVES